MANAMTIASGPQIVQAAKAVSAMMMTAGTNQPEPDRRAAGWARATSGPRHGGLIPLQQQGQIAGAGSPDALGASVFHDFGGLYGFSVRALKT